MKSPLPLAVPFLSAVFGFGAELSAANQVLVVDPSDFQGYYEVQQAVFAAGEGDLIRVLPGDYVNFVYVDGKSVTIVADPPGQARIRSIEIENLAAQQKVVLRGLRIQGFGGTGGATRARVWNNLGAVILEDVEVLAEPLSTSSAEPLLDVAGSDRVLLTRCTLVGRDAVSPQVPGFLVPASPGLSLANSTAFLYETGIAGGRGADAGNAFLFGLVAATAGAPAARLDGGSLHLVGCTAKGGEGGDGDFLQAQCLASADGGAGVAGTGSLTTLDAVLAGGGAGLDPGGCPQVGGAGAPVAVAGSVKTIADTLRRLEAAPLLVEGVPGDVTIHATPNQNVVLFFAVGAVDGTWYGSIRGALLPALPPLVIALGPMPAGGTLSFAPQVAPGTLPAGIDFLDLHLQGFVAGDSGNGLLTSPSSIALVR